MRLYSLGPVFRFSGLKVRTETGPTGINTHTLNPFGGSWGSEFNPHLIDGFVVECLTQL